MIQLTPFWLLIGCLVGWLVVIWLVVWGCCWEGPGGLWVSLGGLGTFLGGSCFLGGGLGLFLGRCWGVLGVCWLVDCLVGLWLVENGAGNRAWCKLLKIVYPRLCSFFAFFKLSLGGGVSF